MLRIVTILLCLILVKSPVLAQEEKKIYIYCKPRNFSLLTKVKLDLNGSQVKLGPGGYETLTIKSDSIHISMQNKSFRLLYNNNGRQNGKDLHLKAEKSNFLIAELEINRKVVFLSPVMETFVVRQVSKEIFENSIPSSIHLK